MQSTKVYQQLLRWVKLKGITLVDNNLVHRKQSVTLRLAATYHQAFQVVPSALITIQAFLQGF
jgi:hypothetical protein